MQISCSSAFFDRIASSLRAVAILEHTIGAPVFCTSPSVHSSPAERPFLRLRLVYFSTCPIRTLSRRQLNLHLLRLVFPLPTESFRLFGTEYAAVRRPGSPMFSHVFPLAPRTEIRSSPI